jgi:hypothetical protein
MLIRLARAQKRILLDRARRRFTTVDGKKLTGCRSDEQETATADSRI